MEQSPEIKITVPKDTILSHQNGGEDCKRDYKWFYLANQHPCTRWGADVLFEYYKVIDDVELDAYEIPYIFDSLNKNIVMTPTSVTETDRRMKWRKSRPPINDKNKYAETNDFVTTEHHTPENRYEDILRQQYSIDSCECQDGICYCYMSYLYHCEKCNGQGSIRFSTEYEVVLRNTRVKLIKTLKKCKNCRKQWSTNDEYNLDCTKCKIKTFT